MCGSTMEREHGPPGCRRRHRQSSAHAAVPHPVSLALEEGSMYCFDCLTVLKSETTAVAVCSSCGAALCGVHSRVGVGREEIHSVGAPTTRALPGRRVWCTTCAPAGATCLVPRAPSRKVANA